MVDLSKEEDENIETGKKMIKNKISSIRHINPNLKKEKEKKIDIISHITMHLQYIQTPKEMLVKI